MIDREVKRSKKNDDGDITALCNPTEWWSPRQKADAINDIENNTYRYFVDDGTNVISIHVVNDSIKGKYLRTDPDKTTRNNLDDLPDC